MRYAVYPFGWTLGAVLPICVLCVWVATAVRHLEPRASDAEHDERAKTRSPPAWASSRGAGILDVESRAEFHRIAEASGISFVMFHAPWSSASQQYYEYFEEVARQAAAVAPHVQLIAVDISRQDAHDVANEYDVRGVPSFTVLRFGKEAPPFERAVPRDVERAVAHLARLTQHSTNRVTTIADAAFFVDPQTRLLAQTFNSSRLIAFGFLRNYAAQSQFTEVVRTLHTNPFTPVITDATAVFQRYGIAKDTVVLYRSASDEDTDWTEPPRLELGDLLPEQVVDAVRGFLAQHAMPLVGDFSAATRGGYLLKRHPMLLFFDRRPAKESKHRDPLLIVAKKWRNVTFAFADPLANPELLRFTDLIDTFSRRGFAAAVMVEKTRFRYDREAFSADLMDDFLSRVFVQKSVPPFRLSGPPREMPAYGAGQLFELSYNNFAEYVLNPTKDSLVMIVNADCQRCSMLMSVLLRLAEKYAGVPGLVVGLYDVSLNEVVEGYAPIGFPTLYFANTKSKGQPLRYTGVVGFKELDEFIARAATVSLKRTVAKDNSSTLAKIRATSDEL